MAKKHENAATVQPIADDTVGAGDEYRTNVSALTPHNVRALVQQGITHKMGSEVASKVKNWRDDNPDASESEIADFTAKARADMWDRIVNGVLGVRLGGGPRKRGLEAITEDVAQEFTIAALTAKNPAALPKKGKGYAERLAAIVATAMANPRFAERVHAAAKQRFEAVSDLGDIDLQA